MTVLATSAGGMALPDLRQELRIERGAPLVNGAPSWVLFDPVRHAFFQLGRIEFRILSRWASGSFDGLSDELVAEGLEPNVVDAAIARVVDFSLTHRLTVRPMGDAVATFAQERDRQRKEWWKWLVDHYLFFRIPLVRPAPFLERTLGRVKPLMSAQVLILFAMVALAGLVMVSRQWDAFMASFLYFFSWDGIAAYALGLSVVKVIHELGHAYTATRFGCRVPSMGVSFLVMFPVLYTDTTGAWRLTSRKQRLAIDCAGVTAELMLATLATWAWVMLPEGSLRSVMFVLATSSWIMSLAVNLNPFMRFDGYYVLADLLDVPNLQPRSFALGRWRMRELLFDLGDPAPEAMPAQLRRGLVIYAWLTWAYRLVLFIGIALLVYTLFFKLLGIILFAVEIAVFVVRPVASEMKLWWSRRSEILATRRGRRWPWIVALALLLCVLPLDRRVSAPAVMAPINVAAIVSGEAAMVDRVLVRNGQRVAAGAIIAELSAPDIAADQGKRDVRIAELRELLARAPSDEKDLANRAVLERELATEQATLSGSERRQARLVLRAPVSGIVADVESAVHAGRWLGGSEVVARVITPGQLDVQAYLSEADLARVDAGAEARFIPDDPVRASRRARVVERGGAAIQQLDQPMLASTQGGPIAVNEDTEKRLKPRSAYYRVRLLTPVDAEGSAIIQPIAGQVQIDAPGISMVEKLLGAFMRLFRREASAS